MKDMNYDKSPRYCGAFIFRLVNEGGQLRFKVVRCQYYDLRHGNEAAAQFKGVGGTSPQLSEGVWEDKFETVRREVQEECGLAFPVNAFKEVLVHEVSPTHHQHFFLVVDKTDQKLSPSCQKDEFEQLLMEWVNLADVWNCLTKPHLRGFRAALAELFRQFIPQALGENNLHLASALVEVSDCERLAAEKLEDGRDWSRPYRSSH